MTRKYAHAFTIAELLICLMIISEIATFTIPKVIASQQNVQARSVAKENIAAFTNAFYQYKQSGQLTANTKLIDITQYMNYSKYVTDGSLTVDQQTTTLACSTTYPCMVMHNGATIQFDGNDYFNGTANTNALTFQVDPDGKVTPGSVNGSGRSVFLFLYYNGRVADGANCAPGSISHNWSFSCPDSTFTPAWFSW